MPKSLKQKKKEEEEEEEDNKKILGTIKSKLNWMKSKGLQIVEYFLSICMKKTHQMTIQNNQILVTDNLKYLSEWMWKFRDFPWMQL